VDQPKSENTFETSGTADFLEDPLAIVNAIRSGEVDAFVVCEPDGDRVYTLGKAEPPYRRMIEEMKEGAALLTPDGDILYCNSHLARLLGSTAMELAMVPFGPRIVWIIAQFRAFSQQRQSVSQSVELNIVSSDGQSTPVLMTASPFHLDGTNVLCLTVSDLSQHYRTESGRAAQLKPNARTASGRISATVSHELRNP
jgi:PAS domain S-box-containing protein